MGIVKRTEKIFPDEIKLIPANTNLMRRVTSISKDSIDEISMKPNLSAVFNLFARNRDLVHFSVLCLMNGGYASTKVLSRAALENTLCMRLFNKKPELAEIWFSNPDKFRNEWKPHEIRKELFSEESSSLWDSYSRFYWQLCDYSHPSSKGWSEIIYEDVHIRKLLWRPVFNDDFASECIGLIFFIIVQSLKPFTEAFSKWLPQNLIEEIIEIGKRDSEMIQRHFRVKK